MPFDFQSGPKYYNDAIQDIIQRSRQLGSEPHVPFRHVSEERRQSVKSEIDRLRKLQKGNEFDIIPFSITGTSEPININPDDLKKIIQNEEFARSIYESATGNHNVSRDELEGLKQRAIQKFESSLPDIQKLEAERQPTFRRPRVESELNRLTGVVEENIGKKRALEAELRRLTSQRNPIVSEIQNIESRIQGIDSERRNFESILQRTPRSIGAVGNTPRDKLKSQILILTNERNKLEEDKKKISSQLESLSSERPRVESELNSLTGVVEENIGKKRALEAELQELSSQRQPSAAAAEEEIHPPGLPSANPQQHRNISPAAESAEDEPQHRNVPYPSQSPQDLIRRVGIEREVNKLYGKQGRIAPMNEYHERSINMMERGFDNDTMRLAADELMEAKRHNELRAIKPLVDASIKRPSDQYMNKYVDDYTKDIRKSLEDESEEEFLEKIAPKINMSFAQMGAFHSGARARELKKAANEHRVKLHREIAHLTGSARDKAMEHHELQKRREQSAAHLLGHTTKSEKEGAQRQAELSRQHAVTKHGISQIDAAALGQIGKAKQEQEQHEIDAEREEFERQRLHRQNQLEREYAILNAAPVPRENFSGGLSPSPMPPNLFTTGAGLLATVASGFGQQPQRTFKKGGSVRKNYAAGGPIGSDEIGNEIRNIIQEQNQAGKSRLEEASNQNPMQGWLRHVGREMLSNPHEDPLLSLGRGTANSMDHRDMMRERAANLYDKIQATKLSQYQILAKYEDMKEKNALNQNNISEHKRHNMAQEGLMREGLSYNRNNSNNGQNLDSVVFDGNEFIPISSKKEKEEILKNKKSSEDILHELNGIKKLSEKYEEYNKDLLISPRTTLIGGIASKVQGGFSNSTQNKAMRMAAVTKAALDSKLEKFKINMETKMRKGVLPEGMRQFMEKKEVFPSSQEPLDIYNKKLEDLMEETKSVYDASKYSLRHNIHISPYDLEKMKHTHSEGLSSNIEPMGFDGGSNIINMIDPQGNSLMVPKDQVEQALKLGASIVR